MLVSSCLTLVESQQDFAAQYHIQTDLGADRFFRYCHLLFFSFIFYINMFSGSRLTLVSTGRRFSDRTAARRAPTAGSTPTACSACSTTSLTTSATGSSRRACSRSGPPPLAPWSPPVAGTLSSGSKSIPWTARLRELCPHPGQL